MPTFSFISEFVVEDERISAYLDYFGANDIAAEKKRCMATCLSVIAAKTYRIAKESSSTFAELKTPLKAHYDPKPLVIAERFLFYRRDHTAKSWYRSSW